MKLGYCVSVVETSANQSISLEVADGRNCFWQWDSDQLLVAKGLPLGCEIHFDMPGTDIPLSFLIKERLGKLVCEVPDELLQAPGEFTVWAYQSDEYGKRTVYNRKFQISAREKPPGYVSAGISKAEIVDNVLFVYK